jgi:hypothetical protein
MLVFELVGIGLVSLFFGATISGRHPDAGR